MNFNVANKEKVYIKPFKCCSIRFITILFIYTCCLINKKTFQLPYYKSNNSISFDPNGLYDEQQFSQWLNEMDIIALNEMPTITKMIWLNEVDDDDLSDIEGKLAMLFYDQYIEEAETIVQKIMKTRWSMFVNITDTNKKAYENITMLSSTFSQSKMKDLRKFNWRSFKNQNLKRGFLRAITLLGDSGISDPQKVLKWKQLKAEMNRLYTTSKVVLDNKVIPLEPNLTSLFHKSRNYDHLSLMWTLWRDSSGKKIGNLYQEYINLSNEATRDYGFKDYGEYSRSNFELPDLPEQFDKIYSKLEKLYRLLHSYVKQKLKKVYDKKLSDKLGPLPAHVLGDMWAQQWHNVFEDIKPYKDKILLDVTPNMLAKNMTVKQMFLIAEEFFVSLGLDPMPVEFWNNSIFERPNDGREMNCHASAWDFYDGKDFRIKMCSKVSMNDLFVVHHEMGHIQYYMNYKHQPFHFKEGANPGFHEALGDLMTLSVMTPRHLYKIKLIDKLIEDEELDINYLLFSALRNIAFAPFALTVEKWRWGVFSGNTTSDSYNLEWWKLRCKYQGLVPPVDRSKTDFDPGSKYHIAASVPYDRYFVSLILTFQFHHALCKVSNHTGPLHKCDIYQSKEAGNKLRKMMEKGSSLPWPQVLKELTDGKTDQIDPEPMIEYFKPLYEWLLKQNLTDSDWDCESFLDRNKLMVKSYSTRLAELTSSTTSNLKLYFSFSKFLITFFSLMTYYFFYFLIS